MTLEDLKELEREIRNHSDRAKSLRQQAKKVAETRMGSGAGEVEVGDTRWGGGLSTKERHVHGRQMRDADRAFTAAWDNHRHDLLRLVEMDLERQARTEFVKAAMLQQKLDQALGAAGEVTHVEVA